jgi:hypothetical protein
VATHAVGRLSADTRQPVRLLTDRVQTGSVEGPHPAATAAHGSVRGAGAGLRARHHRARAARRACGASGVPRGVHADGSHGEAVILSPSTPFPSLRPFPTHAQHNLQPSDGWTSASPLAATRWCLWARPTPCRLRSVRLHVNRQREGPRLACTEISHWPARRGAPWAVAWRRGARV